MPVAGTAPELAVYSALIRLGYQPGRDFEFQSSMFGGRQTRGGAVADFYLPALRLAINVQGTYWHSSPERIQQDRIQQIQYESNGIRIVYIDEADANRNARWYVEEAIPGRDHSRMSQ